jgi:hypothetical protein
MCKNLEVWGKQGLCQMINKRFDLHTAEGGVKSVKIKKVAARPPKNPF